MRNQFEEQHTGTDEHADRAFEAASYEAQRAVEDLARMARQSWIDDQVRMCKDPEKGMANAMFHLSDLIERAERTLRSPAAAPLAAVIRAGVDHAKSLIK